MKTAYIIFKDPDYNYSTNINGTEQEIKEYFLGARLQFGDTDAKPYDDIQIPIDCIVEE